MFDFFKELFDAFCDLVDCAPWFRKYIVFWLVLLGGLFPFLVTSFKRFVSWRNQSILNRDLEPYYSETDVYRSTRYYIETRHQSIAPSVDLELGQKYIAESQKLIPFFIKKAFKKDGNKYYMIFADSGMGKTTFLINLYIRYKNKRFTKKLLNPFATPSYDIKLFPLGKPDILEDINKVEDKRNTIILLDALDEDVEAVKSWQTRLGQILEEVESFREIVITCRTQFFSSEEELPHETGYFSYGEGGEYSFQKTYLSVFDDKDVKKYLRKRFTRFQKKEYKRALEIADKSPSLVARPMLLSQIEDLVKSDRKYEFSSEVYEELIERWVAREAKKPGIRQKHGNIKFFKKLLYEFSQKLAVDLYRNKDQRGGYFIRKGESFELNNLSIDDLNPEMGTLSATEKRSKSLLNRNTSGDYKFSHKSILEYFLAKELMENFNFWVMFDFTGMDATKHFFEEMSIMKLQNESGSYCIYKQDLNLDSLSLSDLNKLIYLNLEYSLNFPFQVISIFNRINSLCALTRYLHLYYLGHYFFQYLYKELYELHKIRKHLGELEHRERQERQKLPSQKRLQIFQEPIDLRKLLDQIKILEQSNVLEQQEQTELQSRIKLLNEIKLQDMMNPKDQLELLNRIKFQDWIESRKQDNKILLCFSNSFYTQLNNELKQINELQERMPNCEIKYY